MSGVRVGLLGPLVVHDHSGALVEVRGAKQQALVACLALEHGRAVTADRLIDEVWDTEAPAGGASTLQVQVSKLRKLLGASAIVTEGRSYRLVLAPEGLDVDRFASAVAAARRRVAEGRLDLAAACLDDALALWRGDALAGLEPLPFVVAARARLDEARRGAQEDRFDVALAQGAHHEIIGELEQFVAAHRLRERAWAQLMAALYRDGRQGDALRAFQTARRHLVDELGVEPGPQLRQIEQQVLNQDPLLGGEHRDDGDAEVAHAHGQRGVVMRPASSFVGRHDETRAIEALLDAHRLVTLVGPGGTGKTRLATEIAAARVERYRDGAWMVELAALTSADQVPAALATLFGLREVELSGASAGTALQRVFDFLSSKQALIVLDNCEHLIDTCARFVDDMARQCPDVQVLATSREALGIAGEVLWPVPPLAPAEAIELFVARARAAAPSFVITDDAAPYVGELCRRLDGLPLAIELAAAKVRTYSLPDLLARLDDRFRVLTGGSRAAMPRQQTMRAVVDWSYDLLDERERQVFDRLAVFSGGCTLEAAEHVCAGGRVSPDDVGDLLARLVDKSLVQPDHDGLRVRYDMLATFVEYGRERLGDALDDARAAHRAYFERFAARIEPLLKRSGGPAVMREVSAELANLRAAIDSAMESGQPRAALQIATSLTWYWWLAGLPSEGASRIEQALIGSDDEGDARARALVHVGLLHAFAGDTETATVRLDAGLDLANSVGTKDTLATGLLIAAQVNVFRGEIDRAATCLESARQYAEVGDEWEQGILLLIGASILQAQGRLEECVARWYECVHQFRQSRFGWALAVTLVQLANLEHQRGHPHAALALIDESIDVCELHGFHTYRAMNIGTRATIETDAGALERAHQSYVEMVAIGRNHGAAWIEAWAYNGLSYLARMNRRLDDALAYSIDAVRLHRPISYPGDQARIVIELAGVHDERGERFEALALGLEGYRLAETGSSFVWMAEAVDVLAAIAASGSQFELAAEALGAADALRELIGLPRSTPARRDRQRTLDVVQRTLGDEILARRMADGAARGVAAIVDDVGALADALSSP